MNKKLPLIFGILFLLFIGIVYAGSNLQLVSKSITNSNGKIRADLTIKNIGDASDPQTLIEIQARRATLSTISTQSVCDPNYPSNIHKIIYNLAPGESQLVSLETPSLPSGTYDIYGVSTNQCCPLGSCYDKSPFSWQLKLDTQTVTSSATSSCGNNLCEVASETPASCPSDCAGYCGDNSCAGSENINNCPGDCGATAATPSAIQDPHFKIEIQNKPYWNNTGANAKSKIEVKVKITNVGGPGTMNIETGIWSKYDLDSWSFNAFSTVTSSEPITNCVPQQVVVQTKKVTLDSGASTIETFVLQVPDVDASGGTGGSSSGAIGWIVDELGLSSTYNFNLASQAFVNCAYTGKSVGSTGADRTGIRIKDVLGTAKPSTTNGFKDGDETSIDCGGTGNPKCKVGEFVNGVSTFCETGYVPSGSMICSAIPTSNNIQDKQSQVVPGCGTGLLNYCTVDECHRLGGYVSEEDDPSWNIPLIGSHISPNVCVTFIPTGRLCDNHKSISCASDTCNLQSFKNKDGDSQSEYMCVKRAITTNYSGMLNSIIDFATKNPLYVGGGVVVLYLLFKKKGSKRKRK